MDKAYAAEGNEDEELNNVTNNAGYNFSEITLELF